MIIHGKRVSATKEQIAILLSCGIQREGKVLCGTVFLKKDFDLVTSVLDKIGLEYEFAGGFDCGVYFETKGIKG